MQIVWTVTLETDTPGPPDVLEATAERVRVKAETLAIGELFELLGDDASCWAEVRIGL